MVAIGIAIGIGEAGEELLLGECVGGVFCATGEIGDGIGINDRCVVGTCESDGEGVAVGGAVVVSDGVVDVDVLCDAIRQALVGGIGWIKAPGAIGVDGQAWDISAEEAVGDGVSGISIG